MALQPGKRLGPYEIVARIGAGGMGEVYRARDTRLGREVALKVLPDAFARDAERMARFEREAKLLASLNHPNIASIYGLEESNTTRALVMELVEGPTLAERIKEGRLPSEEALPIAKQIAEGLEYAHERGIIHRDLKPSNVKVTPDGQVKVLDFGLAKALEGEDTEEEVQNSPTVSAVATRPGVLLGTAAYMSPEQARGKRVDRRADIWAFGSVLYEMLTGVGAFARETTSDTLAAVIGAEPDWSCVPGSVPAHIRELLRRCLRKDPKQRLQAIGDARIAIEEILSGTAGLEFPSEAESAVQNRWARGLPWAVATFCFLVATALVSILSLRAPQPAQVVRSSLLPPPNASFLPYNFAVSPDGSRLAFVALGPDGKTALWVRTLSAPGAQQLNGTEGANFPFWSPDNRQIGFFADARLKTVEIASGAVLTLCDARFTFGGTWNRDGTIVFAPSLLGPLYRVPASGGEPVPATKIARRGSIQTHRWPFFLPDGHHFLYLADWSGPADAQGDGIYAGSLESGEAKLVLPELVGNVAFASGRLLYVRQRTLMAQPFDLGRIATSGPAAPVTEQELEQRPTLSIHAFSVSQDGVLAFQSAADSPSRLVWFDPSGKELGQFPEVGYNDPDFSPDGRFLAVSSDDEHNGKHFIRVVDLKRGISTRLSEGGNEYYPIWSRDGKRITYRSAGLAKDSYEVPANGSTPAKTLLKGELRPGPQDWSPDGHLVFVTVSEEHPFPSLCIYSPENHKITQFASDGVEAKISPDGKWVAYVGPQRGIFVQPFPGPGPKLQISTAGGAQPRWSRDGKQIFYIQPDRKLMAVSFDAHTASAGPPRVLFQTRIVAERIAAWQYDVAPDGRFLINSLPTDHAAPLTLVANWPGLLKKQ